MTVAAFPACSSTGRAPAVHPTAIVDVEVELEAGVVIGPFCVITGRVRIGAGTVVLQHTTIHGSATIGRGCCIGPNATVGTTPSHRGYDFRDTHVVIGDRVNVREFVSVHRSVTAGEDHATRLGDGCLLMPNSHVGHDCVVGREVTLVNGVMLGGHARIGDNAFLGGASAVHQHCRVGRLAILGGGEIARKDVLPFGVLRHGGHRAYNAIGLRRFGLDAVTRQNVRRAFVRLRHGRTYCRAAAALRADGWDTHPAVVRELVEFIEASVRGVHGHAGTADTTACADQ